MSNYDSPLGSKNFNIHAPKEYIVDDPTQTFQVDPKVLQNFQNIMNDSSDPVMDMEVEKQIREAKEQKRTGKFRLSPAAKDRLERLLGMTRGRREVVISDITFVLQTLKDGELKECMSAAFQNSKTDYEFNWHLRRNVLARSILTIADAKFSDFISSDDINDKLFFINEMDNFLNQKLYDEYLILNAEAEAKFGLKKPEVQKEVSEDLKK